MRTVVPSSPGCAIQHVSALETLDPRHHPVPVAVLATIAAGGVVGAVARYGIGQALPHPTGAFAWSTFLINATGCLLIGALMVILTEVAGRPHPLARPFFGVGILGGFTTFSTYTTDTIGLIDHGAMVPAMAYLFGTLATALLAVQLGAIATRFLVTQARKEPDA
jgi:fluoride exporter